MCLASYQDCLGSQHPSPERIPHSIPQNLKKNDITNSPVKESGLSGNNTDDATDHPAES